MLMIRLQRSGKRNRPDFRIVLAEKESSASKKVTEILGHYNPRTKDFGIKQDRLQYWIAQHVTLSPTVHNLFVTQKLIDDKKVKAFTIPAKPVEPEVAAVPATAVGENVQAIGTPDKESVTEPIVEPVAEAPVEPGSSEAPAEAPSLPQA
jgi:small subunit ribosomal protein S16